MRFCLSDAAHFPPGARARGVGGAWLRPSPLARHWSRATPVRALALSTPSAARPAGGGGGDSEACSFVGGGGDGVGRWRQRDGSGRGGEKSVGARKEVRRGGIPRAESSLCTDPSDRDRDFWKSMRESIWNWIARWRQREQDYFRVMGLGAFDAEFEETLIIVWVISICKNVFVVVCSLIEVFFNFGISTVIVNDVMVNVLIRGLIVLAYQFRTYTVENEFVVCRSFPLVKICLLNSDNVLFFHLCKILFIVLLVYRTILILLTVYHPIVLFIDKYCKFYYIHSTYLIIGV